MSSLRQRKNQVTSEHTKNRETPQKREVLAPLEADVVYHRTSDTLLTPLTHASLLVFYGVVHVWGASVMIKLARNKQLNYAYSPVKILMYATIQNLYIQTGYCVLALTSDFMPMSKLKVKLRKVCSWIFTTLAFPLSMIVAMGYWTLYMMDDGFLYDQAGAAVMKHIPSLLNHCWHTAVGLAVLLELLLVCHRHPSHRVAMTTIFLYVNAYTAEVFTMYYVADIVPYPFLRQLGPRGMAVFFLLVIPVMMVLYYTGRTISYLRWGKKCV